LENCIVIRQAVVSDAPEIHALLQKAFREYADIIGVKEVEALRESVSDIEYEITNNTVFAAMVDNKIIGTIRIEILDDEAYISRFAVDSYFRNMGVGESLMNLADKFLMSKGIKKAFLYTASHHMNLVRFYYARGFYIESVSHEKGYPRAKMVKNYPEANTETADFSVTCSGYPSHKIGNCCNHQVNFYQCK